MSVLPCACCKHPASTLTTYLVCLLQLTEVVVRWTRPAHRQTDAMLLRAASRFLHNAAAAMAPDGPGCLRQVLLRG